MQRLLREPLTFFSVSLIPHKHTKQRRLCISLCADNEPSLDNIESSCSSVINRDTNSYDIASRIRLDETFTPAIISAIDTIEVDSFEVNERGNTFRGAVMDRRMPLGSNVTQGPVTIPVLLNDFHQQIDGNGYRLIVSVDGADSSSWVVEMP